MYMYRTLFCELVSKYYSLRFKCAFSTSLSAKKNASHVNTCNDNDTIFGSFL